MSNHSVPLPRDHTSTPSKTDFSLPLRLLAAWSGHGDFAAYHRRFGHLDAQMRCRCGQPTAPTTYCPSTFFVLQKCQANSSPCQHHPLGKYAFLLLYLD